MEVATGFGGGKMTVLINCLSIVVIAVWDNVLA
jgi:hypothetical protein